MVHVLWTSGGGGIFVIAAASQRLCKKFVGNPNMTVFVSETVCNVHVKTPNFARKRYRDEQ